MKAHGWVIAAVLAGVVAATGTASAAPDARRMLQSADRDGDGMVTRAEFASSRQAVFDRLDRNRDGVLDGADRAGVRPVPARLRDAVAGADRNRDGRITRAEFAAAPTPLFDRADTDGNGVVDAYEMARL
ncbi:EF-hand domain-containing protein [Mongoliimonas terrestris]|uniref:EF-hand domain-containing protein n=1 Tax=Mongoliimonas terrestris TaxID=1709001 RepID=UPI0009498A9D|nr:EF-hand domain-containing protein [Mongoliimonas terrestris]